MITGEPLWENIALIKDGILPASAVAVTEPLYVGFMKDKTFYVKSTVSIKIHLLYGPDYDTCTYYLKSGSEADTEDTDREWAANNESIAFMVTEHCPYVSVVIENQGASAGVITVEVS